MYVHPSEKCGKSNNFSSKVQLIKLQYLSNLTSLLTTTGFSFPRTISMDFTEPNLWTTQTCKAGGKWSGTTNKPRTERELNQDESVPKPELRRFMSRVSEREMN